MHAIPSLKTNKFQDVQIPPASVLFSRLGSQSTGTLSKPSGEEFLDPGMRKVDVAKKVEQEMCE